MSHAAVELLLQTLCLHDGTDTSDLLKRWKHVDAHGLTRLVAFERVESLLHRRLSELGLMVAVKPCVAEWLTSTARDAAAWNMLVDARIHSVHEIFTELGIPYVLLKGAVWRVVGAPHPYAETRIVGDVDVLVRVEDAPIVWNQMHQRGFNVLKPGTQSQEHHHLPRLGDGHCVPVEVHTSIALSYVAHECWERMYSSSRLAERSASSFRVPAATEMFWHTIMHAQNHGAAGYRLRFFLDAVVALSQKDAIDWHEIARRLGTETEHEEATRRWLCGAFYVAGKPPPAALGRLPQLGLTRLLRWRLDVFRAGLETRITNTLLDQGARIVGGLSRVPSDTSGAPSRGVRSRTAAATARLCYAAWRAARR